MASVSIDPHHLWCDWSSFSMPGPTEPVGLVRRTVFQGAPVWSSKEAQPCAPARCWASCFLPRKDGARKGHMVAASIWRDREGQGRTNHLVRKETRRELKKQQGIGPK
jgi:hypothetical protein